ncbi:unnamed protein product, partial [Brassica rapa]
NPLHPSTILVTIITTNFDSKVLKSSSPTVLPPSLNNPRYDTSTHRATPKPPLNPITPDTSPTKSSGFAEHASSVNAFVATATSKRTSLPTLNVEKSRVVFFPYFSSHHSRNCLHFSSAENLSDEEVVELSDSSPVKPTPRHQPSMKNATLQKNSSNALQFQRLALIAPLPQHQWDLFHATHKEIRKRTFHITPSQFDFSNRFILEIAHREKWVTTFLANRFHNQTESSVSLNQGQQCPLFFFDKDIVSTKQDVSLYAIQRHNVSHMVTNS